MENFENSYFLEELFEEKEYDIIEHPTVYDNGNLYESSSEDAFNEESQSESDYALCNREENQSVNSEDLYSESDFEFNLSDYNSDGEYSD